MEEKHDKILEDKENLVDFTSENDVLIINLSLPLSAPIFKFYSSICTLSNSQNWFFSSKINFEITYRYQRKLNQPQRQTIFFSFLKIIFIMFWRRKGGQSWQLSWFWGRWLPLLRQGRRKRKEKKYSWKFGLYDQNTLKKQSCDLHLRCFY